MLERFLLLWLGLLSLVAFYWDTWLGGAWNPFEATRPVLNYLFAVAMFAIGWMLPADGMKQIARRWPKVLAGTALQYASMPLLAWLMCRLFNLEGDLRIGVMIVGCVPGAMASNVLSLNARADVSYSVSLTTLSTLLSPLIVPAALKVAVGSEVPYPAAQESLKLCWMVVLPVLAGHVLGRRFGRYRHLAGRVGSLVANLTILWIIAVVVFLHRDRLARIDAVVFWALLCLNMLGYAAGFFGGTLLRLPEGQRRALTLEIGMQNAGLGAVLALQTFGDMAAIAPAMYTFGCMLTGGMLASWWASRRLVAKGDRETATM